MPDQPQPDIRSQFADITFAVKNFFIAKRPSIDKAEVLTLCVSFYASTVVSRVIFYKKSKSAFY